MSRNKDGYDFSIFPMDIDAVESTEVENALAGMMPQPQVDQPILQKQTMLEDDSESCGCETKEDPVKTEEENSNTSTADIPKKDVSQASDREVPGSPEMEKALELKGKVDDSISFLEKFEGTPMYPKALQDYQEAKIEYETYVASYSNLTFLEADDEEDPDENDDDTDETEDEPENDDDVDDEDQDTDTDENPEDDEESDDDEDTDEGEDPDDPKDPKNDKNDYTNSVRAKSLKKSLDNAKERMERAKDPDLKKRYKNEYNQLKEDWDDYKKRQNIRQEERTKAEKEMNESANDEEKAYYDADTNYEKMVKKYYDNDRRNKIVNDIVSKISVDDNCESVHDFIKLIESTGPKVVSALRSNPMLRETNTGIRDAYNKTWIAYSSKYGTSPNSKEKVSIPEFHFKKYKVYKTYTYIYEIISEKVPQDIRIAFNENVLMVSEVLNKLLKKSISKFTKGLNGGHGDEGCIYIDIKPNPKVGNKVVKESTDFDDILDAYTIESSNDVVNKIKPIVSSLLEDLKIADTLRIQGKFNESIKKCNDIREMCSLTIEKLKKVPPVSGGLSNKFNDRINSISLSFNTKASTYRNSGNGTVSPAIPYDMRKSPDVVKTLYQEVVAIYMDTQIIYTEAKAKNRDNIAKIFSLDVGAYPYNGRILRQNYNDVLNSVKESTDFDDIYTQESIKEVNTDMGYFDDMAQLFDESAFFVEKADISSEMKPIIAKLNAKGYKTKYSSPGYGGERSKHDQKRDGIKNGKLYSTARLMFEGDYNFPPAPEGWKWRQVDKNDYLDVKEITYNEKDGSPDEAFAKWKRKYMASLNEWVDNLDKAGTKRGDSSPDQSDDVKESVSVYDMVQEMVDDVTGTNTDFFFESGIRESYWVKWEPLLDSFKSHDIKPIQQFAKKEYDFKRVVEDLMIEDPDDLKIIKSKKLCPIYDLGNGDMFLLGSDDRVYCYGHEHTPYIESHTYTLKDWLDTYFTWDSADTYKIWGKEVKIEILYDRFDNERVTPKQYDACQSFLLNIDQITSDALKHVMVYLQENYPQAIRAFRSNPYKVIVPKSVYIQRPSKNKKLIVSLICHFKYDDENGIGINFVNNKVDEVGLGDIGL